MYSFAVYNNLETFSEMRSYCRRDNASKIFLDVKAIVRKEIALSRSTNVNETHIVKIWGHGLVKLFEVKLKKDNAKVSLKSME